MSLLAEAMRRWNEAKLNEDFMKAYSELKALGSPEMNGFVQGVYNDPHDYLKNRKKTKKDKK